MFEKLSSRIALAQCHCAAFLKRRKPPTRPPPALHTEQPRAFPPRNGGQSTKGRALSNKLCLRTGAE